VVVEYGEFSYDGASSRYDLNSIYIFNFLIFKERIENCMDMCKHLSLN